MCAWLVQALGLARNQGRIMGPAAEEQEAGEAGLRARHTCWLEQVQAESGEGEGRGRGARDLT